MSSIKIVPHLVIIILLCYREIKLDVPLKTRRNGTLFMYVVLALDDGKELGWKEFQRDGPVVIQRVVSNFIINKIQLIELIYILSI
jgi:hypothetical protein